MTIFSDSTFWATVIGAVTTIGGSCFSYIFARRKYSSEVDSTVISNMQKSLEFYEELCKDNKERLSILIKRNAELESKLEELKNQMFNLMASICMNMTCTERQRNFNLFKENNFKNKSKNEKENR